MTFILLFAGPAALLALMVANARKVGSDEVGQRMRAHRRIANQLRAQDLERALVPVLSTMPRHRFGPSGTIHGVRWRRGKVVQGPLDGSFSTCCDGVTPGVIAVKRSAWHECDLPPHYERVATYCGACGRFEAPFGLYGTALEDVENLRAHLKLDKMPARRMAQTGIYR